MINIAIFASGGGSNAKEICNYFNHHKAIKVNLIISSSAKAGVSKVAQDFQIPYRVLDKNELNDKPNFLNNLLSFKIDFIVLAGFLKLIPDFLVQSFPNRILNIHPSLLPKYGGKGMYGHFVHEAVKANKDRESGMTIHIVNEKYDDGLILFQARCHIEQNMSSEKIALEVLKLEHANYARVIEEYILNFV